MAADEQAGFHGIESTGLVDGAEVVAAIHVADAQVTSCAASERRRQTMRKCLAEDVAATCDSTAQGVSVLLVSFSSNAQEQ
jgi:hypothetical protein